MDFSNHPIDVLKDIMEKVGTPMDPEKEKQMRDICDEPIFVENASH